MSELIGFAILALIALASALQVVRGANLVHAVMWLGSALLATAGLYALLGASFLAGVQALLYVGGVITLMVFGVMITRRHEGIVVQAERTARLRGAVIALTVFAVLLVATLRTDGLWEKDANLPMPATADLGRAILGPQILPFEVLSLLLLAAIIGAIVIARRRDPGVPSRGFLPAAGEQESPPSRSAIGGGR